MWMNLETFCLLHVRIIRSAVSTEVCRSTASLLSNSNTKTHFNEMPVKQSCFNRAR